MTSSGTTDFFPVNSDLALDALSRIGIRGSMIAAEHMLDLRMSVNLILADWSANRSVNLWAVDFQEIPLVAGQSVYLPPYDTIMILDAFIRLTPMGAPVSLPPAFTTVLGSPSVSVILANNSAGVGEWVNIIVPVAVGGLILEGYYQVTSIVDANTFTIDAASLATASGSGAVVPVFTTTQGTNAVNVLLPSHGFAAGQSFTVEVALQLAGLMLFGAYTIVSVVDADNFVIDAPYVATASATAPENNGNALIAAQIASAHPTDLTMTPISRDEYAGFPDKLKSGRPSVYWFNRQIQPQIVLWQVPDLSQPYILCFYRMRMIEDWNALYAETPDMPTRFLRAFTAEIAYDMAVKYPPDPKRGVGLDTLEKLKTLHWASAAGQDSENVPMHVEPNFAVYFR